jgi:hypothetical protein
MKKGISLYVGLNNTAEENLILLHKAAAMGISRVFTSLHIPESNPLTVKAELTELFKEVKSHHMEIISDISPKTQELFGLDEISPKVLKDLGITTVRFDFGYDIDEIARFSQDMRVQINASTITTSELNELCEAGASFSNMDALHNYYPRPHTGLSEEFFLEKTQLLQQAGMTVGAFVPSKYGRRGPIFAGLPTLEMHRPFESGLAARHLAILGLDSIFIGDSTPSEKELQEVAALDEDVIVLKARLLSKDPDVKALLSHTFTERYDTSQDAVRTLESRGLAEATPIYADETVILDREPGDITVDNIGYSRYMGEVQILLTPQDADKRTNIAARVLPEERFLLPYIAPGARFRFQFV